jgi:hypothetical protein
VLIVRSCWNQVSLKPGTYLEGQATVPFTYLEGHFDALDWYLGSDAEGETHALTALLVKMVPREGALC